MEILKSVKEINAFNKSRHYANEKANQNVTLCMIPFIYYSLNGKTIEG